MRTNRNSKFRTWSRDDLFSMYASVRVLGIALERAQNNMTDKQFETMLTTLRTVHRNLLKLLPEPDTFEGAHLERIHQQTMERLRLRLYDEP